MPDLQIEPPRVLLVGYRATGKTATSLALAELLHWRAIDTDLQLVAESGRSISAIFAELGEQEFRRLESQVLRRAVRQARVVISTGGGVILSAENRQLLAEAGPVIWLRGSVPTIQSRLLADQASGDARPALLGKDAVAEVPSVLAERVTLYEEVAQFAVDTDQRSSREVADLIFGWLQAQFPELS